MINVMARSENVLENIVLINTLPLELATSYHNINVFENHLRMSSIEMHLSTIDLGFETIFEQ
jgi:hypothetical protein